MAPSIACGRISSREEGRNVPGWTGEVTRVGAGSVRAVVASVECFSSFSFCILITAFSACRFSPISPEREGKLTCSSASRSDRMERSSEHSGIFLGSPEGLPNELAARLGCSDSPRLGDEGILPNRRFAFGNDALE